MRKSASKGLQRIFEEAKDFHLSIWIIHELTQECKSGPIWVELRRWIREWATLLKVLPRNLNLPCHHSSVQTRMFDHHEINYKLSTETPFKLVPFRPDTLLYTHVLNDIGKWTSDYSSSSSTHDWSSNLTRDNWTMRRRRRRIVK